MNTISNRFGVLHLGNGEVFIDQIGAVKTVRDTMQMSISFRGDNGITTLLDELVIELSMDRAKQLAKELMGDA